MILRNASIIQFPHDLSPKSDFSLFFFFDDGLFGLPIFRASKKKILVLFLKQESLNSLVKNFGTFTRFQELNVHFIINYLGHSKHKFSFFGIAPFQIFDKL